ncbi:MAG: terminase family protein [Myxococcaceae bacterium]|nr:terminase family protein [Myxococcaceae bacterium]
MADQNAETRANVEEAWRRGLIQPLLFDSNQIVMSDWFEEASGRDRLIVVNKSRQIGGSYWALVEVCSFALRFPGAQIKYAAQTQKQVRKILRPHLRDIFQTCPLDLRPRYHSQDGEYRFPNGSSIVLAGCDRENAETLRGQHAHLAVVDEGGAIASLEYVVNDILMPQTLNTRGRILLVSSPAKRPGHAWKHFCDLAEQNRTLLERTIYDNPRITEGEIEELCRAAGGPESTTWKREYLAQHVTDEESAVVPEATKARLFESTLVLKDENDLGYRPRGGFDTYIWIDPGWSPDFTGILWAIWDFERGRIIVEKDFVMRRMTTASLNRVLREETDALWGRNHQPYKAVADIDHRLIADLHGQGGWNFTPAQKDNLDEQINNLRLSVSGQRLPLFTHPRCVAFRRQLMNCVWNKARTKFDRTALDGHFDLVAAAYMGRRHFDSWRNPTRSNPRFSGPGVTVIPEERPASPAARTFSRLFRR